MRDALTFAVFACHLRPRCAPEANNAAMTRIDKIVELIRDCRWGIHDISRTELSEEFGLPRFNMPLELGLFLGAHRFGSGVQREKTCLVLDSERFRYQRFISDIAGHDVIPVAPTGDWYARRVGVAAAREINMIPAGRLLNRESKVRPAGISHERTIHGAIG